MSKFIDMLQRVGQQTFTPMGFGAAVRSSEGVSSMMLIGQVTLEDLTKAPGLSGAHVDALLVRLTSWEEGSFDDIADSLKGRLWGVGMSGFDEEQTEQLKAKGCDFIEFDADATAAAVLNDEDLGKVISVGPDLDEDIARAINELPIDGVIFTPAEGLLPLTVRKLIDIGLVCGPVDKPFVIEAPAGMGARDLEAIRNTGVAGLVVEISSLEEIGRTRKVIENLPRRKVGLGGRDVVIPQMTTGPGASLSDPGEVDEDEDNIYRP